MKTLVAIGKAFLYFILYIGVQFSVVMVGMLLSIARLVIDQPQALRNPVYMEVLFVDLISQKALPLLLLSTLLTLAFLAVFFAVRKKNILKETKMQAFNFRLIAPVLVLAIATSFFIVNVMSLLPIPENMLESLEKQTKMFSEDALALSLIVGVLLIPLLEEVLFRGLILTRLCRGMPAIVAVILSSTFFAIAHGLPIMMAYTMILGLVWGWVVIRTGSLLPAVILHVVYNLTTFMLSFYMPEIDLSPTVVIIIASGLLSAVCMIIIGLATRRSSKESLDLFLKGA